MGASCRWLAALLLPCATFAQGARAAGDILGAPLPSAQSAAGGVLGVGAPLAAAGSGASAGSAQAGGAVQPGLAGGGAAQAVANAAAAAAVPVPAVAGGAPPAFVRTSTERLEFHARGLAVADAFAELRRLMRRNIVVSPDVTAAFTGDLYDLTVEEILAALCRTTGLVAREEGGYIYVEMDKPATRVFALAHARAEDAVKLIQPLLSPTGQITATPAAQQGIISSQEEAGGDDYASTDLIVVRDFSSRLAEIDGVVREMDALPAQVLIEATILMVALADDMAFGVDLNLLDGVDFEDANATSDDGLSVDVGPFDGEQLDDGLGALETNVSQTLPTGGLNVGYLKNGIAAFIRALQTQTDATVLANPRIVTMNKQRGEVLLGRRDGYLTTIVTQTSTTQIVDYLETGTRLIFRPFITGRDMVRLEVHPEDSTGGLNSEGLPFKETAEVTTNILIRNGETVVIGGLFREREELTERKVPVLGDVPLLGVLFRSEDKRSRHEEIIIVLTPHIMFGDSSVLAPAPSVLGSRGSLSLPPEVPAWALPPIENPDPAGASAAGASLADAWVPVSPATVQPLPVAPAAVLPAETPADARVVNAHLALAQCLYARGNYGAFGALLASLTPARRSAADARDLSAALEGHAPPLPSVDDVDRRLLDLIGETPASR